MGKEEVAGFVLMNLVGAAISFGLVYWAARTGARSACMPARSRSNKLKRR